MFTLLILGPLVYSVILIVNNDASDDSRSFPERLDAFLINNPRFAMRIATLGMIGLYVCVPRLKSYAFFELAIYAAMLVADLPRKSLAVVLAIAIAVPAIASGAQIWQFAYQFNQTVGAVFCYGILLLDVYPAFLRLKRQRWT